MACATRMDGVIIKASPVKQAPLLLAPLSDELAKRATRTSSIEPWIEPRSCYNSSRIEQSYVDYDADLNMPIRGHGSYTDEDFNPLLAMCFLGFNDHRPIVLTPDLLWHYITKGIAMHVEVNSEALRHKLVYHEGKKELNVRRDEFRRGAHNDWPAVFRQFRTEIEKNIKPEAKSLIGNKFSTTTETIEATSCITLMDTLKNYFKYDMMTLCGIPSVTLQGKLEDWEALAVSVRKAIELFNCDDENLSLQWWSKWLCPVLDRLVTSYVSPLNQDTQDWMARIYKYNGAEESGRVSFVTGWINVFFPYTKYLSVNRSIGDANLEGRGLALEMDDYSSGISKAPFTWLHLDKVHDMSFLGGPCCVTEQVKESNTTVTPLGSLHVHFGWAVVYNGEEGGWRQGWGNVKEMGRVEAGVGERKGDGESGGRGGGT